MLVYRIFGRVSQRKRHSGYPRRSYSCFFAPPEFVRRACALVVTVGLGTCSENANHAEAVEADLSNATIRPMPDTVHSLPWAAGGKYRVGEVLCESFWMWPHRDGAPQAACTRHVARTQLDRLSTLGYRLMSGFEAEFFVYRQVHCSDAGPCFQCCMHMLYWDSCQC